MWASLRENFYSLGLRPLDYLQPAALDKCTIYSLPPVALAHITAL